MTPFLQSGEILYFLYTFGWMTFALSSLLVWSDSTGTSILPYPERRSLLEILNENPANLFLGFFSLASDFSFIKF